MNENQLDYNQESTLKRYQNPFFEWSEAMVHSILIIVFIFTFFVRIVGVSGDSMLPTLENNDKLLISKVLYTPEYLDIVVLTKKSFGDQPIIKRVIATEGQTVDIDYGTGDVYVDDILLEEKYTNEPTYAIGDMIFPVTVPEDHVFVLGDNRNASSDSRLTTIGMVSEDLILGRVVFRLMPFDKIGKVD